MVADCATCPSLTAMVLDQAESLGDKPLLWAKRGGEWRSWSWRETVRDMLALAGGLVALGLVPGDRVMLVSENRPEWVIADLAIMAAGGITVPSYTTNTPAHHLHILNNSGARFIIVSTRALAEKVLAAAWQAANPPQVITLERPRLAQASGQAPIAWERVTALGADSAVSIRARIRATRRTDTACLIHTSGTAGAPKGVMLSHGAILANCLGAVRLLATLGLGNEVFLSFLPLSHAYEHTAGLYFPLALGAQIYYAEGLDQLMDNLAEVRPTVMTAVPRLYESLHARLLRLMRRERPWKARLFFRAVVLGQRRIEKGRLSLRESLLDILLDLLVRRKIRARFGGRLKALVSGGAPLPYEIGVFLSALGLPLLQGYGQTETAPLISCNPPRRVRLDTVGPPVAGVAVRLAGDGEICVQGELLMQGYWNDADATAQAIHPLPGADGLWLHTGDIGEIDPDGYIRITDRKKDIIVNSGGDNIAPQRIEGLLTLQEEIAQAMVYGDRRPHLVALIVPAEDFAADWARRHRRAFALETLVVNAEFRTAIGAAVDRLNRTLPSYEKIRRFALIPTPFSVENGLLTPTLKIRRHKVLQQYGPVLAGLYE